MSKLPLYLPPERGNRVYVLPGRPYLPEALVIHNRFNTPFTLNFMLSDTIFHQVALSHIFCGCTFKNVNCRREKV